MFGTSSKRLLLMRHAKSDWSTAGQQDQDRPLNARGQAAAPIMADWLATQEWVPEVVLCSSAVRTRETLRWMLDRWQSTSQPAPDHIQYLDELYLAAAASIVSIASKHHSCASVLVLGHNPGMEQAVSYLGQDSLEMPTGAIAVFETEGRNWPEDWLNVAGWKMRSLGKPRELMS
jgi:phosphohistidine phosphatase